MNDRRLDRRSRQRAATEAEIRDTARQLLIQSGPDAMSVNAVARNMGLSGPAIYRYYSSHDELVGAVIADLFTELADAVRKAGTDPVDTGSGARLLAMSRSLRAWSGAHPNEFRLLFATPIPEANRHPASVRRQAGESFDEVFINEVEALWREHPFPVPDLEQAAPSLRRQVLDYTERKGTSLPPAAAQVFLSCWTRLYGLLVMEALGQLAFAYSDPEPVFEQCLREFCDLLGIDYRPPH